ncbi:MAG: flagellar basal body rod protein FlgB [Proteobacteria bacterium]|nr:flagellar basal body rod protein FlgB [Pseudomonadota bacterium]
MGLDDIPLFAMLRGRLGYLSERQQVIAQNIANSDTPGYTPSDLKPFTLGGMAGAQSQPQLAPVAVAMTSPMHLVGTPPRATAGPYRPRKTADSETTLDGNSVVLEDEMIKMNQTRMDYDAAISFYQKSLGLIRLATKKPGS